MNWRTTLPLFLGMLLFHPDANGSPDPLLFMHFPRPARKPGVLFKGTDIPSPPQQNKPWQPPASRFSAKWISAFEELVHNGFADPRGCEYREVVLTYSSSQEAGNYLVATHAWVIPLGPSDKVDSQRFAVTWDGLVYPVVTVGKPADLKKDVETLIEVSNKETDYVPDPILNPHWSGVKEFSIANGVIQPWRMREWAEEGLVSTNSLLAIKTCLLLRLGETALAERLWDAWTHREGQIADPYLIFAWEWTWALFDRAVGAHNRGDDVLVVHTAKMLIAFERTVSDVARQRHLDDASPRFLVRDRPEVLLQDSQRRLKAGAVRRVLEVGLDKFPERNQRIAALIRDLEEVAVGPEEPDSDGMVVDRSIDYLTAGLDHGDDQNGNPLKSSPIVRALVREGEATVEPLLECLVNDHRLTRVIGQSHASRDGVLGARDFVTVDLAAYAALCGILRADGFGPLTIDGYYHNCHTASSTAKPEAYDDPSPERRRAVAAEIRRRFEKVKGQCPEEGWRAALADHDVGVTHWLRAAQAIVAPVVPPETARKDLDETGIPSAEEPRFPLAGEPLRGKKNPSVTELLIQRSDEIARDKSIEGYFDWRLVYELTLCLGRWDAKAAIPVIHRHFVDLRADVDAHRLERPDCLAAPLADLIEAGLHLGEDELIVQDYVAWLHATRPSDFTVSPTLIFVPLWRHSDNPNMASLARWLFLADDAPWHSLHRIETPCDVSELPTSPLIGVPAFREMLKRELTNTSPNGEYEAKRDSLSYHALNTAGGGSCYYAPDVELPESGISGPLRACDYYAVEISRLEGSPRYEMYWPEKRRNAVCKDVARFLDQRGNCFRDRSKSFPVDYDSFSHARFCLPRLAEPATPEDVAGGRAIFSLRERPDAQVRIVALKTFPHIARWKTLKQFRLLEPGVLEWPKDRTSSDPKVWASLPEELYDREGLIWQAEEVLLDGKWRRFYGFVGNHVIAKVPAEEIDLLDEFSPAHPNRF